MATIEVNQGWQVAAFDGYGNAIRIEFFESEEDAKYFAQKLQEQFDAENSGVENKNS